MKTVLYIFLVIISIFLITFTLSELDLIQYKFFAPKYEDARRKTFEKTQSYVQGKITDLSNYKFQMDTTKDSGNKAAIRAVIRAQFNNFDINDCPYNLKQFLIDNRGF
jgi:hypothetical protein